MSKKAKRKKPKEKPLKIKGGFEKSIDALLYPINEKYTEDRQALIDAMKEGYECPEHHERIFGEKIDPRTHEIYFMACCKKFWNFISAKMAHSPLKRD